MSFELKTLLNSKLKTQGEHGGIPSATREPLLPNNYQLSTLNSQLSTINYQLSTLNSQL
ncbi:MAG: hypothetical protein HC942_12890 [Microcoleus sp. SU_5_6]|nr:hypothetical protein [Microcoleus sp. SU_5_6]NJL68687.1 hypothetical protein [Microcoleus sp. SM1_3_4]